MTRKLLPAVRYGLPAALILTGLVLLVVGDTGAELEAWAMFTGAGVAVLLLNLAFRFSVTSQDERAREAAAREFYERHGRWPQDSG